MSGPTKGMVAGQAIVTGAQTKDFDEGYERVFGKVRQPARGRWVMDPETRELVQVGGDWEATDAERTLVLTDRYMEGDRAVDGTDISNRTRRRDYMERKGLADTSDFTNHWKKAEAKREAYLAGKDDSPGMHETIGRALYEAKKKRRR